ncbi:MAG: hypothetical protein QM775_21695 [Pirellulales bacterium]
MPSAADERDVDAVDVGQHEAGTNADAAGLNRRIAMQGHAEIGLGKLREQTGVEHQLCTLADLFRRLADEH